MRRFVLSLGLFAIVPGLYIAFVVLVDPFERFLLPSIVPEPMKAAAAPQQNCRLWRIISFENRPGENVLLGNSKMGAIRPVDVRAATGLDFTDLSLAGGSGNEIVDMFWFAAKRVTLRNVWVGLNVESFNRMNNRDAVVGAEATAESRLLYVSNQDVLTASVRLFSAAYLGAALPSSEPPIGREEFWRRQLDGGAVRNFAHYVFDEQCWRGMIAIAAYCRAHEVQVKFIILPNHAELHERIRELGAGDAWRSFPARVAALGDAYDFDVDDDQTRDRARFGDPFHFDAELGRTIVAAVAAGKDAALRR